MFDSECPICYNSMFDETMPQYLPVMFCNCQHCVCYSCVKEMLKHQKKQIELIGNNKQLNVFDLNCPPWVKLVITKRHEPAYSNGWTSGGWSITRCPMCRDTFSNMFMLHYEELAKQSEDDLKSYLYSLKDYVKDEYTF